MLNLVYHVLTWKWLPVDFSTKSLDDEAKSLVCGHLIVRVANEKFDCTRNLTFVFRKDAVVDGNSHCCHIGRGRVRGILKYNFFERHGSGICTVMNTIERHVRKLAHIGGGAENIGSRGYKLNI